MDHESTRFIPLAELAAPMVDERLHCLELLGGPDAGRRHAVGPAGLTCGRAPPADIVIAQGSVSRAHCRLTLSAGRLIVTDLGATNGTCVDGVWVSRPTPLPVGGILTIGDQHFRHELLTAAQLRRSDALDRDLAAALGYVEALLPPTLDDPRVAADWVYQPCAKLGGDVFGYAFLSDTRFAAYLIDVSGHGAGAAMHGVAVMNLLHKRALPAIDMADPGEVLAALNAMFPMERHADMYFTIWYGVFDTASRRLDYASGGHHAAFLTPADRHTAVPLRTRGPMIGASPAPVYATAAVLVPPGASLYLFSDGVFEIVDSDGREWTLADFAPLILGAPVLGVTEPHRLHARVRAAARDPQLDDDFSLVVLTFP